jgi:nucleoside-diphosphate-sugar epimerase
MLIPQLLDAMEADRPIDVTDGTQLRDFLFVDDLAQWIVACIQSGPPRSGTVEEHLVASGQPLPVSEIFRLVKEAFPSGVLNVGAAERRPEEPQRVELPRYASDRPVLSAWRPTVDIARGLEETIRSRGRAFEQEIGLG